VHSHLSVPSWETQACTITSPSRPVVVVTVHVVRDKTVQSYYNQLYNVYPSVASVHTKLAFQLACPEISAELIISNVAITVRAVSVMLL